MAARDTNSWETAIAKIEPHDVIVRGERMSELIGNASFAEVTYLILSGKRATKGQARVLEALLVSVMDHSIAPSSTVARLLASYGVPIQAAIAGGALTFGDIQGGAGQELARNLSGIVQQVAADGDVTDEALRNAAKELVADSRARRVPLDGFGHPQHDPDFRTPILLELAKKEGVFSHHSALLSHLEDALAEAIGRRVGANIDGASAALLLDLGLKPDVARALIVTPRTVGLAAHYLEEIEQGNTWRHVPAAQVTYTGVLPEES
ncbi:citrate/2-methylcitrate synthase [Arthrobacter sp. SIMBA_036]|uniref:citrate/2-methylcitrate synthase n=1 Tax=Arthrobacter sp. SIMBA_036 TaxID=3085778 RepID=UPI00397800AB